MERGSKTDILRDRETEGGRENWREGGTFGGWGVREKWMSGREERGRRK